MKKNLVSLIMPVWNQLSYTQKALSSLKTYTSVPYELIIINNASTDGTKEYLEDYRLDQKNITIIHNKKNLGWVKALNQGIRISKGNYIGILNNDVLFSRDWLKKLLAHFGDPAVGAVGPTSNAVAGRQISAHNDGYSKERANFLIGFCIIFRKELIKQVGDFDERFSPGGSEETDYAIRIRKETKWKMEIARDVFIWHKAYTSLSQLPEWGDIESYHKKKHQILLDKWGEKEVNDIYAVPPKVLIAVPHTGSIPPKHYASMMLMAKPLRTEFVDVNRIPIQIARNMAVQLAQRLNAEYVFFIDSDAIVTQDLLLRLLKHDKDITGIVTHTRNDPYFPCVFERCKTEKSDDFGSIDIRHQGLKQVAGVGLHACLIHSRVFDTLKDPWFEFTRFGEDLTFMEKAIKSGFKVWCDTDIILDHIGEPEIVTEQTFLESKIRKEAREKLEKEEKAKDGKGQTEVQEGQKPIPKKKLE